MTSIENVLELLNKVPNSKMTDEDVKHKSDSERISPQEVRSQDMLNRPKKKQDILDAVGEDGPWQFRIFFLMLVAIIPAATLNLSISFLAPNLDHWCTKPTELENISLEEWKTFGLPDNDKQCFRYENLSLIALMVRENNTDKSRLKNISCDSWDYDDSFYVSTLLSEWNLVCEHEWLVSLSKSIFMAGTLIGVFAFGFISDLIGRRPTISICCSLMVMSAFVCGFAVNFTMFMIARFFVAMGVGGYYVSFFVLLMEVCSPDKRTVYGLAVQFGWCIGYVCLPGIAYIIRDWFWLQMALTLPCIFLFGIWWIIPESPRWLLSKGRTEEAREVLESAARTNNRIKIADLDKTLNMLLDQATEVHATGENKGTVLDLLTTPGLWKITLNVYYLWFVNAFVYFGISFNTNDFSGDPHLNFFLFGLVEFPAYFLCMFAVKFYGRRRPLATAMIVAGISYILSYFLPEDPEWLTTVVSIFGKFCIAGSFGIVYVYTTELFPTVVRNVGVGSASLCEGIGSIIAPFVKELGEATHPAVLLVVIGALAFSSGVLVLFLPETHNCIVPDTFKEAAAAVRLKKVCPTEKISENCFECSTRNVEAPDQGNSKLETNSSDASYTQA